MSESADHFHYYRRSYVLVLLDKRVELKCEYFLGRGTCDNESREVDILSCYQANLPCVKAKLFGQVTNYMTDDVRWKLCASGSCVRDPVNHDVVLSR